MSIKSGFFNSNKGDRVYSADDLSTIYEGILTDGVVKGISEELKVTAPTSGMKVVVGNGKANIDGKWLKVMDAGYELTIPTSNSTNPRIDLIVARLVPANREILLAVKIGTAASTPTAPNCTYSSTIKEIPLAQVRVNAKATTIVSSNITDVRQFAGLLSGVENVAHYRRQNVYVYEHLSISDVGRQIFSEAAGQTDVYIVKSNGMTYVDAIITPATVLTYDGQYVSIGVPLPDDTFMPSFAQIQLMGTEGDTSVSVYEVLCGHGDYMGVTGEDLSSCGQIVLYFEASNVPAKIRKICVSYSIDQDKAPQNYGTTISF